MANFDAYAWLERLERIRPDRPGELLEQLSLRFPEWARGYGAWRGLVRDPGPGALFELRNAPRVAEVERCPRVFVSHKREDEELARCLAWLANQRGFEIWLDVLDPELGRVGTKARLAPDQQSILRAAIIEMGLLNSSHVLAVITPKTRDSRWVPYEYGRVKDDEALSARAACWLAGVPRAGLPEYFLLGPILDDRADLDRWLAVEQYVWQHEHRSDAWAEGVLRGPAFTPPECRPEPVPRPPAGVRPCA